MTEEPRGVEPPNYTQLPNSVLELMPLMSECELRVVLFIARQTFGWHKKRDKLSISQIMKATGLSNTGVIEGTEQGIKRGLIKRTAVSKDNPRKGFYYSLLVNDSHKACEPGSQALVRNSHIQKKGKETYQKKTEGEPLPEPTRPAELPPAAPHHDIHPFVKAHKEIVGTVLNRMQRAELEDMPLDADSVAWWRENLRTWMLNGWSTRSLPGMIDRYRKGPEAANSNVPRAAAKTRMRGNIKEELVGGVWYPVTSSQRPA